MTEATEPWIGAKEAAAHLGVRDVRWLYRVGDQIGLPCSRLNGARRYRRSELDRWLLSTRESRANTTTEHNE